MVRVTVTLIVMMMMVVVVARRVRMAVTSVDMHVIVVNPDVMMVVVMIVMAGLKIPLGGILRLENPLKDDVSDVQFRCSIQIAHT